MNLKQALSHYTFWHIFFMLMCSMSYSYFMKPSLKTYGSQQISNDSLLTIISSIAFLTSSISKFAWGSIQDKLGFKKVYFVMLCIQLIVTFTMQLISMSEVGFTFWMIFTFVCEGAHFVFFPSLASSIYGPS